MVGSKKNLKLGLKREKSIEIKIIWNNIKV